MTPESLVRQTERLFSFPDAARRVQQLVDAPSTRAQDLAEAILCDAALSARLLRVVNSPVYAPASPVTTVTQAVNLVGTRALRDLVFATATIDAFKGLPKDKIDMERFWLHAVACGIASRTLSLMRGGRDAERLFLSGLLHGLGKLILLSQCGEQYLEVLRLAEEDPTLDPVAAEERVLGFNYADVSAELLVAWSFPDVIWMPVRHHLQPEQAANCRVDAETLHVAVRVANDILASEMQRADVPAPPAVREPAALAAVVNLPEEAIAALPDEINLEVISMLEILLPGCSLVP